MERVAILQHRLMHYRVELFEQLRRVCARRGIDLAVVHGQASKRESTKKDEGSLSWAHRVRNRFMEVGARDLVWQPFPAALREADLVVVMQESRILSNYPLLLSRFWSHRKLAYWGHGRNFQSEAPTGLREQWKKLMLTRVDWWFAYTDLTRDILLAAGYPAERITVLENAIDNEGFRADLDSVNESELAELRAKLSNIGTPMVGLFCGSLYPEKRIAYLIEAADIIHTAIPNFMLVLLGDGPSAQEVRAATTTRPWLHWAGPRKGRDKAMYFRLANVVLNPGAVGLHVLDSFCAGAPLVTTAEARHGPEIAYLEDGVNGQVVRGNARRYADTVIRLLNDEAALSRLRAGALASADRYTLANMVERFAAGIEYCLAMPRKT